MSNRVKMLKYKCITCFGLIFCFLMVFLVVPQSGLATALSPTQLTFENLTEDIGRGFGSTWNRYAFSMAEYGDQVYVGTWNIQIDYPGLVEAAKNGQLIEDLTLLAQGGNALKGIKYITSTGAEIWRNDGEQAWTQVHKDLTDGDTGYRQMIEYNGRLYAGSANSTGGTNLIVSDDNGENWTVAKNFGEENNSIRTMVVNDGKLFIGTENNETGGELWSIDNGTSTMVHKFTEDSSVAALTVYGGKMHVGTWDFTDGYALYREGDGSDPFDNITPTFPGSGELANLGVMKLIEFKGELYLGTVNYENGFTLLKTTDTGTTGGWQVISTDGLGDSDNAYAWSMVEWNGKLYIGTFNSGITGGELSPLPIPLDGRAELWCSENGSDWSQVFDDGLDSKFTYGIRNMLVSDDKLYLGTASNFFVPDLLSELYNTEGFDIFRDELKGLNLNGEQLAALEIFLREYSHNGEGPFIGTQIYAASAPVPEPATVFLLGLGILGLAGFNRRKKSG